MKKHIVTAALVAMGLAVPQFSVQASTASALQVTINNSPVSFENAPILHRDMTMVPMRDIFQKLGADILWNQDTQTITASKQDKVIELKLGSSTALINYQEEKMDVPAMIVKERTFVPLRFIGQSLGAKVDWDQQRKTVNIILKENKVQVEESVLTFEKALKWAHENSDTLRKADQEIKRKEIMKEKAEYDSRESTNDSWESLLSADVALQMSKKEKEVAADQVVFLVKHAYQDIFLKENELEAMQMAYDITKMQEEVALAKDQIGQISEYEKEQIIKARLDAGKNLQEAKTALQDAKDKLNSLMGKPKEIVYQLVDKHAYKKPENLDIELHIQESLSVSPSIWQLEKRLEMANRIVDNFTSNTGQSYDLAKMDVEQANSALVNGKEQFGESIRTMYLNLNQLDIRYGLLVKNLQSAEDNLQMVQKQFEKGWVTLLEVKKAQLDIKQKKNAIEDLVVKIDQAQYKLTKPWIR